ncbi:manganese efflux pump MntP [Sphingomonas morindae]|uniref:Putative manganese efflux pump MntP n=1 Tax=Sphingomonas morindae TaxID=1541170 RepID=A0ABY4XBE5_9SPHN|nr:manganese efflux pump MntP family protein [Sphingomonas morindae]USI74021.1 manganese efflux pump MntP family protein [Sphingomonas morindae]
MVGLVTLGALGLGLSVDAFAAAVCRGADGAGRRFATAVRVGAVFGFFEALTPAIGWALGLLLAGWIAAVDHWVAFGLLAAVGAHMLLAALRNAPAEAEAEPAGRANSPVRLALTALATSIDAMAVGVSLAVLHIDILTACLVIGGVTTVVATAGVLVGRTMGVWLGRWAEVLGGVALIAIGAAILYQHLSGAA